LCQQYAVMILKVHHIILYCKVEIFSSLLSTRTIHTYNATMTTSTSTNWIWKDSCPTTQLHNILLDNPFAHDCSAYLQVLHISDLVPTSSNRSPAPLWCHHICFCLLEATTHYVSSAVHTQHYPNKSTQLWPASNYIYVHLANSLLLQATWHFQNHPHHRPMTRTICTLP